MFDDDDPLLAIVRAAALALPEAAEKIAHGRPTFFTTKVFAYYGGGERRGPGDHVQHPASVLILPDHDDEPAMRQDERFWMPAYLGPRGWLGIDVADTAPGELAELLDASFRRSAPRRLVDRL
ncbi:MmcQ/YjbR family DNA-binding protein [Microbacterium radiodurans]|uniref:MmcQ/YjbR family DNA-binding protein n=2 Tax=Microbacterium radiodurans TaxID=661398 RepID=A0A5J5IVT2_9MICO|nr:MmcQ/YjbR family DNA-binding protein [Microbacterium radiodurans]